MNAKNVCIIVLCILLLQGVSKNTKAQTFQWAKQMGGTGNDIGNSIAVDESGNIYTIGYFSGVADFDPGLDTCNLISVSNEDIYISKLDAMGNLIWVKQIGGANSYYGASIAVDDNENVYITGFFFGTVDFDPGFGVYSLTSAGASDVFICKLDVMGNLVWVEQIGGISTDVSASIAVDANGNIYSTGGFSGVADFDPGVGVYNLTSVGACDVYISKLDAMGNFVWAKKFGGASGSDNEGNSIAVDENGNIYTVGRFSRTVDFDPGVGIYNLTATGSWDVFISKLNAMGDFIWAKRMGGIDCDWGNSIAVDGNGGVYTVGWFKGTADFDPGAGTYNLTPTGACDVYISKLDAMGNFVWAKKFGGAAGSDSEGNSIAADGNGNVYLTGSFEGTVDFDPGTGVDNLTSVGACDIYISKLDVMGNFVWAKKIGGMAIDRGYSIAVDSSGNVYTTGFFQYTTNFNPENGIFNLTSAGLDDVFIQKMSQSVNVLEEQLPSMKLYPIPTNGILTLDLGSVYSNIELIVRNELGQKIVRSSFVSKNKLDFMIPGKAGMYFVELNLDNNKKSLFKVIKE